MDAGDITIGATGRLGSRGLTRSIALRNANSSGPMNIGGTGQQGQFSLDKNEAARLFADQDISFIARSGEGGGGDVRIGELALSFGDNANIGTGGLLKVEAGGLVEVNGAVTLTTVSDNDAFSIDPARIDVIAGSGSIVMRNAAGQTIVPPFSVRWRPRAPVSMPLDWDEVSPRLDPGVLTLRTAERRMGAKAPWSSFFGRRQTLPRV